ncbi:MAG: aminoacyl-tRNA hydrolase [Phycisphaeraceae bacterium]|nr:aminoacyl-tRNA hydrolase [Phycisphaeraceae bacterium]
MQLIPGVNLPDDALEFSFIRSSGPGGQNVNKLATKTRLRVKLAALESALPPGALARLRRLAGPGRLGADGGELILTAEESRSQGANRQACLDKLAELLQAAWRPPKHRRPTRPTHGSQQRRLKSKQKKSAAKKLRRSGPIDE